MLRALIYLPLWARIFLGTAGLTLLTAALLGYLGRQPIETIAVMVGFTVFTISQMADFRPDRGQTRSERLFRGTTRFMIAFLVLGWMFILAGLVYVCLRRGTIWLDG